jgi:hypothetical protein
MLNGVVYVEILDGVLAGRLVDLHVRSIVSRKLPMRRSSAEPAPNAKTERRLLARHRQHRSAWLARPSWQRLGERPAAGW